MLSLFYHPIGVQVNIIYYHKIKGKLKKYAMKTYTQTENFTFSKIKLQNMFIVVFNLYLI